MKQCIVINQEVVYYDIRVSKKARNISISVESDECFEVLRPVRASVKSVNDFIEKNTGWIFKKLEYNRKNKIFIDIRDKSYYHYKNRAYLYIYKRAQYFSDLYNFEYNKISIKKLRTKWGSCSSMGNLNFNYSLLFLPRELADYIIVHELCHLKHLNHSQKFWLLVGSIMPDYKKNEKLLNKIVLKY